jgi:hypothetical protein
VKSINRIECKPSKLRYRYSYGCSKQSIDAVNDPSVTVASNNTVVTALNALTNDTLSGIAATTTNTNVTPLTTGTIEH